MEHRELVWAALLAALMVVATPSHAGVQVGVQRCPSMEDIGGKGEEFAQPLLEAEGEWRAAPLAKGARGRVVSFVNALAIGEGDEVRLQKCVYKLDVSGELDVLYEPVSKDRAVRLPSGPTSWTQTSFAGLTVFVCEAAKPERCVFAPAARPRSD